jgi:hypothetical protein
MRLNGLKMVWSEISRLGDDLPAIHYFLNSLFEIIVKIINS